MGRPRGAKSRDTIKATDSSASSKKSHITFDDDEIENNTTIEHSSANSSSAIIASSSVLERENLDDAPEVISNKSADIQILRALHEQMLSESTNTKNRNSNKGLKRIRNLTETVQAVSSSHAVSEAALDISVLDSLDQLNAIDSSGTDSDAEKVDTSSAKSKSMKISIDKNARGSKRLVDTNSSVNIVGGKKNIMGQSDSLSVYTLPTNVLAFQKSTRDAVPRTRYCRAS